MDDAVTALADQQAQLTGMLDGLDDADWQRPSRCEGWTVADVVLHLAQTNEMAIASVDDRFADYLAEVGRQLGDAPQANVDDGAALMVAKERDRPLADLKARWQASVDDFLDRLKGADFHRRVMWVAGELSIRTLVTTRLAETWIHTGDVADGLGVEVQPTERLKHIARLAWRTLPYAFSSAGRQLSGPVAFDLRGPTGAEWEFTPDDSPQTTIRGDGVELCLVAARRIDPQATSLTGDGPDADAVLQLVRTYA
ncbi:MAG TPA: maleylpyruvate isomerase family mycothiol-dependent enzyme [Acidimicrobiales bacterium]|nr:maleylpyruvate isomerase family mycothiol-dependent enzyme [Acidimicrobiales bacterium]